MTVKNKFLTTTLLAGVMAISAGIVHAETVTTTTTSRTTSAPVIVAPTGDEVISKTTTRTVRPLAVDGDTLQVKPAIQRFIERVNLARYNLSMKDPVKAKGDLDEAEKHLNFIKQNSRYEEISKKTVIASGKVAYQTGEVHDTYYLPLEEGPVVVKSIEATGSQSGKNNINGLAVTSADVVYLNVDLSGKVAPEYIAKARASIKEGDLKAADDALQQMLKEVTYKEVVDALPAEKARDNLQLAFKFLQDENYTASRYALEHAKQAFEQMGNSGLAARAEQIHGLVMQEDKNVAQKARTQIIALQGDIK